MAAGRPALFFFLAEAVGSIVGAGRIEWDERTDERIKPMQATYQKTTVHGHVCTETAAEHVLPDYQGDIKKVLSSTATVIPAGKFISGTEAQLSGSVAYDILYADAQGQLTSAQFSSDYELSVPVSEDTRDAVATVTVAVD